MSYDINVYLDKDKMPTPKSWRAAIIEEGFDVILDSDFNVDDFKGFLPCLVSGKPSGFEYYSSNLTAEDVKGLELPENMNFSINFCIHSNPLEMLSATAASSVLAKISKGLLVDPQVGGGDFTHENVVQWAKLKSSENQA